MIDFVNSHLFTGFIVLICLYFAVRLLVFKDINLLIGKSGKKVKDPEKYTRAGGILVLIFAALTVITSFIQRVAPVGGMIVIVVCVVLLLVGWSQIEKKYGDINKK